MATHKGSEGTVKVGSNAVAEIGRDTSELQSHSDLVCRLLLEKKKKKNYKNKNTIKKQKKN